MLQTFAGLQASGHVRSLLMHLSSIRGGVRLLKQNNSLACHTSQGMRQTPYMWSIAVTSWLI